MTIPKRPCEKKRAWFSLNQFEKYLMLLDLAFLCVLTAASVVRSIIKTELKNVSLDTVNVYLELTFLKLKGRKGPSLIHVH